MWSRLVQFRMEVSLTPLELSSRYFDTNQVSLQSSARSGVVNDIRIYIASCLIASLRRVWLMGAQVRSSTNYATGHMDGSVILRLDSCRPFQRHVLRDLYLVLGRLATACSAVVAFPFRNWTVASWDCWRTFGTDCSMADTSRGSTMDPRIWCTCSRNLEHSSDNHASSANILGSGISSNNSHGFVSRLHLHCGADNCHQLSQEARTGSCRISTIPASLVQCKSWLGVCRDS